MKPPTDRPFSQPRFIVTACVALMSAENCCAGLPHALSSNAVAALTRAA